MPPPETELTRLFKVILIMAGLVILIQAMIVSKAIIIPLMMSVVIAIICLGPSQWLMAKGVPFLVATSLIVVVLFLVCFASFFLLESSIQNFQNNIPEYTNKFKGLAESTAAFLGSKGIHLEGQLVANILKPESAMKYASVFFQGLSTLLTKGFFVFITVVFILAESSGFTGKISQIPGNVEKRVQLLKKVSVGVQEYMLIKSMTSFATGVIITIFLLLLGVDYAFLWGMLAFGFNFVPNIGSIIAAVPAVLLALVQLGPVSAGLVALCYLMVNIVIGTFIEPRFMGKKLGLSTLVVFLSLIFWGWVLGPVGMLLSVILTMTLKIALDNHKSTQWLGILLGPNPEGKSIT